MVDVSIIFVNYHGASLTKAAIESVIEKSSGFSYEIIVVDNSQSKEEIEALTRISKDVKVIDSHSNLGFGKANNLGVEHSNGKYVYFLNNDTLLINNAINELKVFLDEHKDVGIVGSNLFTKDSNPNHSFIKHEKNLAFEKKTNSLWYSFKSKFSKKRKDFNYSNKPLELEGYVCGASLMMSKEDFKKLGGFDNDIFMYAEESLLCYRLKHELKKKIYNVPSSKIIHLEGGSTKGENVGHIKMMVDGNFIYFKKIYGEETAIKYLEYFTKMYAKKAKLSKNKDKKESFKLRSDVYKEKYLKEAQK